MNYKWLSAALALAVTLSIAAQADEGSSSASSVPSASSSEAAAGAPAARGGVSQPTWAPHVTDTSSLSDPTGAASAAQDTYTYGYIGTIDSFLPSESVDVDDNDSGRTDVTFDGQNIISVTVPINLHVVATGTAGSSAPKVLSPVGKIVNRNPNNRIRVELYRTDPVPIPPAQAGPKNNFTFTPAAPATDDEMNLFLLPAPSGAGGFAGFARTDVMSISPSSRLVMGTLDGSDATRDGCFTFDGDYRPGFLPAHTNHNLGQAGGPYTGRVLTFKFTIV